MAIVCDTSGIYAIYDADDRWHVPVRSVVESGAELIVPTAILSEIDYLLTSRLGAPAAFSFVESVHTGAFRLEPILPEDVSRCLLLLAQYRDLELGLADACIVAVAERLQIDRLLTLDQKHFRVVRPRGGDAFVLLPADAAAC